MGLAFALRLYRLDFQSIWWDEGHSIFVASHPIANIPTLPAMDVHPPLYFVLLHLWMAVSGNSEFALRYLSVIFSLLTVALLWRFAREIAVTPLVALFATLSPMYIAYAQEVRSYACLTFLALASTYYFRFWILDFGLGNFNPKSKIQNLKSRIAYILLTTASLYTHYFTLFLLLFQNLFYFGLELSNPKSKIQNLKSKILPWLIAQIAILLLFIPQLRLAMRQVTDYANPNLLPPTLSYFITHSWQAYTVGLTLDPDVARWGMGIMAVVMVVSLSRFSTPLRYEQIGRWVVPSFLLAWLIIPLLAYFVVLQQRPSFEPRYLMLVTPALFLILAGGMRLAKTLSLTSCLTYACIIAVILNFTISLNSYYYNENYFKDDSTGVAAWLATETTANDVVYVDVPHPFHYYVSRAHIAAPTRYLFVDIHTAAETLSREASGHDRLYWITWYGSDTDPRGVIPFLAEKYGRQLGQRDFRGYRVRWFNLPKEPFSLPNDLKPIKAMFGEVLQLDGAAFGKREAVWATLHFTLLHETNVDYRVSLRLRNQVGQVVSQIDKDLLNDRHFRTSAWPLSDSALNQAINVYLLPLPPTVLRDNYRLEAVVYNAQPPYPSEGVTGAASMDGVAVVGTVMLR